MKKFIYGLLMMQEKYTAAAYSDTAKHTASASK